MKNEVFARAMTQIDDELIKDAHAVKNNTRLRVIRTVGSAAACLAVVIIAGILLFSNGVSIKTEDVFTGNAPSDAHLPAAFADGPDTAAYTGFVSVRLTVKTRNDVQIEVSDGVLTVSDGDGNAVYAGDAYEGKSPVSVIWTVENPDEEKTYSMTVNGKTVRLISVGGEWKTEK